MNTGDLELSVIWSFRKIWVVPRQIFEKSAPLEASWLAASPFHAVSSQQLLVEHSYFTMKCSVSFFINKFSQEKWWYLTVRINQESLVEAEDSACSPPKTLQGQMSSQIPVEVQSNSTDLFLKEKRTKPNQQPEHSACEGSSGIPRLSWLCTEISRRKQNKHIT